MSDPCIRRRFVVAGRVQGVGYRWYAQLWGERLGLRGWVSNREDGTVESEAEGRPDTVREYESRLRAGPAGARVDAVETTERKAEGGPAVFDIL